MTREQMYDLIINKLGHEHKATIWFIQFSEEHPNADNDKLYRVLDALLELVRLANEIVEEEE